MPFSGPTANLPARAVRSGRSGQVWQDGKLRGEIIGLDWNVTIAQIPVVIIGAWQDENKPGAETRAGTFRFKDVDDHWALLVYDFVVARRNGDRSAAAFPEFSLQTKLDDIGAPDYSEWVLDGCQLFEYMGGFSADEELLTREVPFSFRTERPLHAFEYVEGRTGVTTQTRDG
jgi:hypothetical protein